MKTSDDHKSMNINELEDWLTGLIPKYKQVLQTNDKTNTQPAELMKGSSAWIKHQIQLWKSSQLNGESIWSEITHLFEDLEKSYLLSKTDSGMPYHPIINQRKLPSGTRLEFFYPMLPLNPITYSFPSAIIHDLLWFVAYQCPTQEKHVKTRTRDLGKIKATLSKKDPSLTPVTNVFEVLALFNTAKSPISSLTQLYHSLQKSVLKPTEKVPSHLSFC